MLSGEAKNTNQGSNPQSTTLEASKLTITPLMHIKED
jgi:hypothetical protein